MTSLTADDLHLFNEDGITASMSASARTGSTGEGSSSRSGRRTATAVSVIGDSNEWRAGGRRALSRRNEWCLVGRIQALADGAALQVPPRDPQRILARQGRSVRVPNRAVGRDGVGRRRSRVRLARRGVDAHARRPVRASTRRYRSTRCTSDRGCVAPTDSPFRTARPASGSLGTRTTTASRTWSCSRSWSIHSSARGVVPDGRRTSRRRLDFGPPTDFMHLVTCCTATTSA